LEFKMFIGTTGVMNSGAAPGDVLLNEAATVTLTG